MTNNHDSQGARKNLKIDGSGTASGGVYDRVRVNGSGKIQGDIDCDKITINGSGSIQGNMKAQIAEISGSVNLSGDAYCHSLRVDGIAQLSGCMTGERLVVTGTANISKTLDVQSVKVNGTLKVGANCSAETFAVTGSFTIEGLLNADSVLIKLHFKGKVKEIGGGNISVKLGNSGLAVLRNILPLEILNPILEADIIEGDTVFLENTVAKVVRGTDIVIGKGCSIGLVEYKGILRKEGDGQITEERKI